jgi:hypothetical protein
VVFTMSNSGVKKLSPEALGSWRNVTPQTAKRHIPPIEITVMIRTPFGTDEAKIGTLPRLVKD